MKTDNQLYMVSVLFFSLLDIIYFVQQMWGTYSCSISWCRGGEMPSMVSDEEQVENYI